MQLLFSILLFTNFPKVIHIVPLGPVSSTNIQVASQVIKEFYGAETIVEAKQPLNSKYKNEGNYRYSADLILKNFNSNQYTLVLTEQDITTMKKGTDLNWGIFGLGYKPGKVAVVSAFKNRIGRNVSGQQLRKRLRKVIIHEIGHNLGLDHCTYDKKCVMHAAEGKGAQIDIENEEFCSNCKLLLNN